MGRNKLYESAAERQRAYRKRLEEGTAPPWQPPARVVRRQPSRPAKLKATQLALQQLHDEYERWLESLPETLEGTDQASRLSETVEQLEGVLELLSEIHLPRGFGRD